MAVKKIDALQTAQIVALQTDVGELRTKLNLLVGDIIDVDGVDGATRDGVSKTLNRLIDDLNDMNDVVMKGYTSPASPESHGILEAIDIFQLAFDEHKNVSSYIYAGHDSLTAGNSAPLSPYIQRDAEGNESAITPNLGYMTHTSDITMSANSSRGHGMTAMGEVTAPAPAFRLAPPAGGTPGITGGNTGNNEAGTNATNLPPVLGGTDQGTNSDHSADAANANVTGQYDNRERLLESPIEINRARKLVRNVLNKLRSK